MAVKQQAEVTLTDYSDADSIVCWYQLNASATLPSKPTTTQTSQTVSGWQKSEPTISSDADAAKYVYSCWQTNWGDGSCEWGDVSMSASFEAAKRAWNKASAVQTSIDNLEIGGRNLLRFTTTCPAPTASWSAGATLDTWLYYGTRATYARTADGVKLTNGTSGTTPGFCVPLVHDGAVEFGDELTLSFVYRGTLANTGRIYILCNPSPNLIASEAQTLDSSGEWARFSFTFTVPSSTTVTGVSRALLIPYKDTANAWFEIKDGSLKLERGNVATGWTPAPEDMASASDSVEYIVGTQTAATNLWTGVTKESSLVAGKTIAYYLPYAGNSSAATLNLTLSGGGTSGAKNVKYNSNNSAANNVTTHYGAGSVIQMTYDGTYWRVAAGYYDTSGINSSRYRTQIPNAIKAAAACTASHIICGTASGYRDVAASVAFDLDYPLLWCGTAIASGSTGTGNYLTYNGVNAATSGTVQGVVQYSMVFLKGTVSGNTFTCAASNYLTCTAPTSADDFVYIPLGIAYNTTPNIYFNSSKDLYAYIDGKFRQVTPTEIVATHKIYYRTQTELTTSQAMQAIKPNAWVSESAGIVYNQWTPSLPPVAAYASSGTDDGYVKYPYVYMCEQRKRLDGTVECTAVVPHKAELVVDGDAIIDGSISTNKLAAKSVTADQIDATNLQVDSANIKGQLSVEQIDTSGISLTKTQVVDLDSDLASLSDGIDAQASALTSSVGEINQAIESTNTSLSNLTQTVTNVTAELDGRIKTITDSIDIDADHISLLTQTTSGGTTEKMEARLTSSKLAFVQDSTEVAYIGDESLNITNAVVQDTLTLGDFAFVPLATGGLALKWMGE